MSCFRAPRHIEFNPIVRGNDYRALVQTVNVPVYGRDGTYSFDKLGERSFGKWATHVRELLTAHATLAKVKLIPRDSILEAAKDALWNTYPALADVRTDGL